MMNDEKLLDRVVLIHRNGAEEWVEASINDEMHRLTQFSSSHPTAKHIPEGVWKHVASFLFGHKSYVFNPEWSIGRPVLRSTLFECRIDRFVMNDIEMTRHWLSHDHWRRCKFNRPGEDTRMEISKFFLMNPNGPGESKEPPLFVLDRLDDTGFRFHSTFYIDKRMEKPLFEIKRNEKGCVVHHSLLGDEAFCNRVSCMIETMCTTDRRVRAGNEFVDLCDVEKVTLWDEKTNEKVVRFYKKCMPGEKTVLLMETYKRDGRIAMQSHHYDNHTEIEYCEDTINRIGNEWYLELGNNGNLLCALHY